MYFFGSEQPLCLAKEVWQLTRNIHFFLNGLPCITFVQLVQFKIHVHILGFVDKYVNHISNSLGEEIHKSVASEEETLYI